MKAKGHLLWFSISFFVLSIIIIVVNYVLETISLSILKLLIFSFFFFNPDIDLLFGIKNHRHVLTHTFIFPIIIFYVFRRYLDPNMYFEFQVSLIFPILVHDVCDYRVRDMVIYEKKGSWLLTYTFGRFNVKQTRIIMIISNWLLFGYLVFILVVKIMGVEFDFYGTLESIQGLVM